MVPSKTLPSVKWIAKTAVKVVLYRLKVIVAFFIPTRFVNWPPARVKRMLPSELSALLFELGTRLRVYVEFNEGAFPATKVIRN
jgi:hypothetical protein